MAVYQALLLNTVVPQIQAAQAGDSYVMVVNATTPALRITQTGTGDSILVEDAANPDSSPFVVTAAGDVGIGTNTPTSIGSSKVVEISSTAGNSGFLLFSVAGSLKGSVYANTSETSIGSISATPLLLKTGDTTKATLDTSGNLGLGVTPSASTIPQLQFGSNAAVTSTNTTYISANATYDGGWEYITAAYATQYQQTNGTHVWWRSTSAQVAGTDPSFTQAMTLDASGNLGVGTTSPLSVAGYTFVDLLGSTGAQYRVRTSTVDLRIGASATDAFVSSTNSALWFGTNNTERARITSGGDLLVGTQTYGGVTSGGGNAYIGAGGTANANTGFLGLDGSTASGCGAGIGGYANGANGWFIGSYSFVVSGTDTYFACRNSGGGGVYLNGSTATSWTAVSDETRKIIVEDIVDAVSKVATLRTVIGRLKTDSENVRRPYLLAQDVKKVLPEAVSESEDKEGKVLGLSYTEVIPLIVAAIKELKTELDVSKAAVALQEAMARIETLEAKIAALEAK